MPHAVGSRKVVMKVFRSRCSPQVFKGVGLFICSAFAASAQLYTGSLTGTVLDPSGASVADADISLTDTEHRAHYSDRSDRPGRYLFRSLSPGAYTLQVAATVLQS